jgi:nickel transport system substrate-binding protein
MKVTRTGILLLICLLVVAVTAGCASGKKGADAGAGKTVLTMALNQDTGPLDPHRYSPNNMFAQNLLYEPLVKYNEEGKIVPWLAESWDISPDGKKYTFHLRKGVVFSDGTPFNAKVVKQNFDKILSENKNEKMHGWLELLNQIQDVEVVDNYTVSLTLKNPYYPVLQELALTRPVRFLSPTGLDQEGKFQKPIGTGPWVLSEYQKEQFAVFTRNEKYWGVKPAFQKLIIKVIPDKQTRVLALESGEVDFLFGTNVIDYESLDRLKSKGYSVQLSQPVKTNALALNTASGPTREEAVRLAIQYAVDRKALAQTLTRGYEEPASTYFAPNFPYCNLGLEPYSYDPQKAVSLLEQAGWKLSPGKEIREKDGQPLRLELYVMSEDSMQKTFAEAIQGMLKSIGIGVDVIVEEGASVYKRQKDGSFHLIFSNTWGPPYDPHSLVASMRAPSHADYQAQKGLPDKKKIDEKIGKVLVSVDEKARQDLYREILGSLHRQGVYLPLTYTKMVCVYGSKIGSFAFSGTEYELDWGKIRPSGK